MNSLLEMLANQLDDNALNQISTVAGANQSQTQQAISAALPMLLGALGRNAAKPEGAQALTQALARDHDGSILNNLSANLQRPEVSQDGAAILNHILGNRRDAVAAGVGQVSGLDANSVTQIMSMLAPVVLGAVGQAQHQNNLSADQVASLLHREREQTESSLGGLAGLLDMDGDGSVMDDLMVLGSSLLNNFFGKKK